MGRYIGPKCKLCRREKTKLFLRGARCSMAKCAIEVRNSFPGVHPQSRKKLSNYGIQLREKQKLKRMYGLLEKQFKLYFKKAAAKRGITGEILLQFLERRLDNICFKVGFVSSRGAARQLVQHGHVKVNGIKVNIPSFLVKEGDIIEIREKSKKTIADNLKMIAPKTISSWLSMEVENLKAEVLKIPTRDEIEITINEQLIVELYSK
jgi:small subunit ribosomal protein S4